MNLIGSVFFVWIIILTWVVMKVQNHYQNLVSRTKKERIDEILDELLQTDRRITFGLDEVKKELREEIKRSKFHMQRIGLVRFNPFERIGGEQSFVISFLDEENNGIVVNYIYTREGLRVYTKKVKAGKGEEYELSEEEKKAVEKSN